MGEKPKLHEEWDELSGEIEVLEIGLREIFLEIESRLTILESTMKDHLDGHLAASKVDPWKK